jgi:hypothetical protein
MTRAPRPGKFAKLIGCTYDVNDLRDAYRSGDGPSKMTMDLCVKYAHIAPLHVVLMFKDAFRLNASETQPFLYWSPDRGRVWSHDRFDAEMSRAIEQKRWAWNETAIVGIKSSLPDDELVAHVENVTSVRLTRRDSSVLGGKYFVHTSDPSRGLLMQNYDAGLEEYNYSNYREHKWLLRVDSTDLSAEQIASHAERLLGPSSTVVLLSGRQ